MFDFKTRFIKSGIKSGHVNLAVQTRVLSVFREFLHEVSHKKF